MSNMTLTTRYLVAILASAIVATGCTDKVSFASVAKNAAADVDDGTYVDPDLPVPPVEEPPVVVPPPVEPPPVVVIPPPVEPPPVVVVPPPVEPPPVVIPPPVVVVPPPVEPPPVVVVPPPIEPPPVVIPPPVVPPPPPVVVVPPVEQPALEPWTATCPAGRDGKGSLNSCLSCPVVADDLSGKAKRLLDTMERACQIPNKSAPAGYVAPTRAELIKRLQACSPQVYPDTVLTKEELAVIPALAGGNQELLQRMFGRLWYSPPYSDAFDHYFGLGIEEAVPLFCYKTKTQITGELWSREMWDWFYRDFIWGWPQDLQNLHAYYQHVRSGLVKCLDKAGTGGPTGAINNGSVPYPKCDVKGYKGVNRGELKTRVKDLLAAGYAVSLENSVSCLIVKDENVAAGTDVITLAAIKCE